MKTSELTGAALDWAVAKCEGWIDDCNGWLYQATLSEVEDGHYKPSTDWAQGGPIIERERLWIGYSAVQQSLRLFAMEDAVVQCHKTVYPPQPKSTTGPTILVAAMRCYVASKLGDNVEIPEELTS